MVLPGDDVQGLCTRPGLEDFHVERAQRAGKHTAIGGQVVDDQNPGSAAVQARIIL